MHTLNSLTPEEGILKEKQNFGSDLVFCFGKCVCLCLCACECGVGIVVVKHIRIVY